MRLRQEKKFLAGIEEPKMNILSPKSKVMILINVTTLMHKSTLNTNNFGNNHFGQKYQKQNILRISRRL